MDFPKVVFTKDIEHEWREFRQAMGKLRHGIPDCVESWDLPVYVWLTTPAPRRALYFTKLAVFRRYTERWHRVPPVAAIAHPGLPDLRSLVSIAKIIRSLKCPVFFVGDLDPGDLTIYAALRCGSPDLARSLRGGLPIRYFGIGGSRFRRIRDRTPKNYWIPMDEAERLHFDLIRRLYPSLEAMIGTQEMSFLLTGKKLEIEAVAVAPGGVPGLIRLLDSA